MSMTAKELARRLEESFVWWVNIRDTPSDIDKKIQVINRAINDLYALHSHALETIAQLEGLPPGALGRRLWLPSGMEAHGSMSKFG